MYGVVAPVFKTMGLELEELELNGRGGWRAKLANNAVVQLGGGDEQELLQRTRRFARTLAQVAAQYQRRVDALESADLRHVGGYALKLRGGDHHGWGGSNPRRAPVTPEAMRSRKEP